MDDPVDPSQELPTRIPQYLPLAGVYRIKNCRSGTYLSCNPYDDIRGWDSNLDSPLQKWEFEPMGGSFLIRNVGAKFKYLSRTESTLVMTRTPTLWDIEEWENSAWTLAVPGADLYLDLTQHSNIIGATIKLSQPDNQAYQTWRFKRDRPRPVDQALKALDEIRELVARSRNEISTVQEDLQTIHGRLDRLERIAPLGATEASDLRDSVIRTEIRVAQLEGMFGGVGEALVAK